MTRAIVIYHSLFGNTEAIATQLAEGLKENGIETSCVGIDNVELNQLATYDFIAIGGPTHMIGLSRQMKAFLRKLKTVDLRGLKGFSFDTRNKSRMNSKLWLMFENSAARKIEGKMKKMKVQIIHPRHSAIVEGREGPLDQNAELTFKELGKEIASLIS
ncbi:MAG: flavodoxin family protein [Candidatus Hodarchaeota archaeon]